MPHFLLSGNSRLKRPEIAILLKMVGFWKSIYATRERKKRQRNKDSSNRKLGLFINQYIKEMTG
jgi:hypothetical protein